MVARTKKYMINMTICVNLLLIHMKKQGSECTLKDLRKFVDVTSKSIQLFIWYLVLQMRMCLCIYVVVIDPQHTECSNLLDGR